MALCQSTNNIGMVPLLMWMARNACVQSRTLQCRSPESDLQHPHVIDVHLVKTIMGSSITRFWR